MNLPKFNIFFVLLVTSLQIMAGSYKSVDPQRAQSVLNFLEFALGFKKYPASNYQWVQLKVTHLSCKGTYRWLMPDSSRLECNYTLPDNKRINLSGQDAIHFYTRFTGAGLAPKDISNSETRIYSEVLCNVLISREPDLTCHINSL